MDTDHLKADSTNWDIENTVFSFQVYVLQYHIKETQFLSFSTVLSLYTEKSAVARKKRKKNILHADQTRKKEVPISVSTTSRTKPK